MAVDLKEVSQVRERAESLCRDTEKLIHE